jgi:hypothetical protein
MMAAWQPVPPLMIFAFAHRMSQWVEHFRQAEPDAQWLAAQGHPAMRQRLAEIIDQLRNAVAIYQQTASQAGAPPQAMAPPPGMARPQGMAPPPGMARPQGMAPPQNLAMSPADPRDAETIMRDTRAATEKAWARQIDTYSRALFNR